MRPTCHSLTQRLHAEADTLSSPPPSRNVCYIHLGGQNALNAYSEGIN